MYGLKYNYYEQNRVDRLSPCNWMFAGSIDCSGNLMESRDTLNLANSGWKNEYPIKYPNPVPCTYKVSISGLYDTYNNNCSIANGDWYINNYNSYDNFLPENELESNPYDINRDYDLYLGKIHFCQSLSDELVYFTPRHANFSMFISGDNPHIRTSGVRLPPLGDYGFGNFPAYSGNKLPRYWLRAEIYPSFYYSLIGSTIQDRITLLFDSGIEYSGQYGFLNGIITSASSDYCGNSKYTSGIDFTNKIWNFNAPIVSGKYDGLMYDGHDCNCNYFGTSITLTPIDDCSDELYSGLYKAYYSMNFANSGVPSIARVRLNNIVSEHNIIPPSSYKSSTCDASILEEDIYLKYINNAYNQDNWQKDLSEYNVCCDCSRNPCVEDITLEVTKTQMTVTINSVSGVLATYRDSLPGTAINYGTFEVPLLSRNPTFDNQINFSGSTATVEILQPTNRPCGMADPLANSRCYTGSFPDTITIPIAYSNATLGGMYPLDSDIGGQTFILNNGAYNAPDLSFHISLYPDSNLGKYILTIQEYWPGFIVKRRTYYATDITYTECYGFDCSSISSSLTPYADGCIAPGTGPTCSSELFHPVGSLAQDGQALGTVTVS